MRPWGGQRPTLRDARGQRTENKDTAAKWAWEEVSRLRKQTHAAEWGVKPKRTLEQAALEYLQHRKQTMAWNTWRNDRAALNHLVKSFGGQRDMASIQADLQDWFDEASKAYNPKTLALYAGLIKGFFAWAEQPLERPKTPVHAQADPETLTANEIEALLKACRSQRELLLVQAGLATGGRKAELWALEWKDFRPDMRTVRFQRQMGWPGDGTKHLKGKRSRTALLLPGFLPSVRPAGGLLFDAPSADVAQCLFRELLKRAGLYTAGRGLHVLRHTYARIGMEEHEWSTEMVRIFLGHESITSVEVYAHFGEQAAIRLAERRTYQQP